LHAPPFVPAFVRATSRPSLGDLFSGESGQDLIEYALVAALLAVAVATAVSTLGNKIGTSFNTLGNNLTNAT
jgi:pilus assembly protein Flp/PilA